MTARRGPPLWYFTWLPTLAAWVLFGWRGLLWGVIATGCGLCKERMLRDRKQR